MPDYEARLAALENAVQILHASETRREAERANEHASALAYADTIARSLGDRVTALEADSQLWRDAYEKLTAKLQADVAKLPKLIVAEYEAEQSRAQLDKAFEGAPPGMKEAAEEWALDLAARVAGLERRAVARDEDEQLYRDAIDARFITPERLAEAIRAIFFSTEPKS